MSPRVNQARSPVVTNPPVAFSFMLFTRMLSWTSTLGISLAPPVSKAPEVLITFRSPRELNERTPSNAALSSASGVRPAVRSSSGAAEAEDSGADWAAAEAGSALCCATGAGSSAALSRAF